MKVTLLTQVDRSGACRLLHEAEVPPFVLPPRVVFWGTRVFVRDVVQPHEHAYVESFAFCLLEPTDGPLAEMTNRVAAAEEDARQARTRAEAAEAELRELRKDGAT